MARQLHTLTDLQLRQLIKLNDPVAVSDGGGLTFTLSKAGTASWILRYRIHGKRSEITLGNYPDTSLSAARQLASQCRASVDMGTDPAAERAARKREAATPVWTVRKLAEDYRSKRLTPEQYAENTLYYRIRDLENFVIPLLGSRQVEEVTGMDVVEMLQRANKTWTVTKRLLNTASKVFEHAAGLRLIHINPCIGISLPSLLGARPPIKPRVMLSKDDLHTLLREVDTLGEENGISLRILLATCVRSRELTAAEWKNVDLNKGSWYVPNLKTKTRRGFYVPLTAPVIEWFRQLRVLAGNSPYVLPARIARKDGQPITARTLWAAIDRAFKAKRLTVTKFTPHDARSTAKGHMLNLGVSPYDSERALNHVVAGVAGIYDVRKELPEKMQALKLWADYLLSLAPPPEPPPY